MTVATVGWMRSPVFPSCSVTSDGRGTFGRVTKFTPSSCNVENSVITESSGKIGIGTTSPAATLDVHGGGIIRGATGVGGAASGGFEFQVSAPNQVGLLVQGPASGVGAGLDLKTTGTGGLQWEILDTGATAAQGADKLNIRNVNTASDVLTISSTGNVGIGTTSPDNGALDIVTGDQPGLFLVNDSPLNPTLQVTQTGAPDGPIAIFSNNSTGFGCSINGAKT
jgi:hypothetical protein